MPTFKFLRGSSYLNALMVLAKMHWWEGTFHCMLVYNSTHVYRYILLYH